LSEGDFTGRADRARDEVHAGSRQVARVVMLLLKNLVHLDFHDDPRAPRGYVRTCDPEFSRPVRT
jgi:hypothetical protein